MYNLNRYRNRDRDRRYSKRNCQNAVPALTSDLSAIALATVEATLRGNLKREFGAILTSDATYAVASNVSSWSNQRL